MSYVIRIFSLSIIFVYSKTQIPVNETFALMYASNKSKAPAYHYGIHEEDFTYKPETYMERIMRFRTTYQRESQKQLGDNDDGDPPSPTNEVRLASLMPSSKSNLSKSDMNANAGESSTNINTDPNSNLARTVLINANGNKKAEEAAALTMAANQSKLVMPVSLRSIQAGLRTQSQHQNLCIICQERKADVTFEPCHHSVMCSVCWESKNVGKKFCPVCRTSISLCLKPDMVKFVRPRVFSAFSFVDA